MSSRGCTRCSLIVVSCECPGTFGLYLFGHMFMHGSMRNEYRMWQHCQMDCELGTRCQLEVYHRKGRNSERSCSASAASPSTDSRATENPSFSHVTRCVADAIAASQRAEDCDASFEVVKSDPG